MKNKDKEIHFLENLKIVYNLIKGERKYFFILMFLALIIEVLMIADNLLIKFLVDNGEAYLSGKYLSSEVLSIFTVILSVFLGIVIFRSILRFFQLHWRNRLMSNIDLNTKKKYFDKVIDLDYEFHTKHKTGELISKLNRGSEAAVSLTELSFQRLFPPIFSLVVVLFSIAYFDLIPALITTGTGVLILIFSWKIFGIQARTKLSHNEDLDNEKGFLSNILSNFESVKLFGKENSIKKKYLGFTSKSRKSFIKFNDYYRIYNVLMSFTLGLGTVLLLYFSLLSFLKGNITLGTTVFIFVTFGRMIAPIVGLSDSLRSFNESMSDIQALFSYDKIKSNVSDSPDAKEFKINQGEVEFKNVTFSYGKRRIFDKLNLKIKSGEKIAIVGPSGQGKTSLIRLLFRLYDPDSGKILIDGQDIKYMKQDSLRNQLSVVPQEPVLFHDSIYNNIKFSNPDAKYDEVLDVIKLSSSEDFVKNLPLKEKTSVGERGIRLSGGEKQRIAIARALLASKKILVLDEPTSSLDLETENKIQEGIEKLLRGKTAIIVAHRLSTIKSADRIIVLKGGNIVEQGSHNVLLKKQGEYARLWKYQKKGLIK